MCSPRVSNRDVSNSISRKKLESFEQVENILLHKKESSSIPNVIVIGFKRDFKLMLHMNIQNHQITATGLKFYVAKAGVEVARAYLYLLTNDLHAQPFGLMEDVFVSADLRGQGIGSELVRTVIEEAKRRDCYKLICTCRNEKPSVQALYAQLGFREHGKEFRINFGD